jgi:energy-coupling factor transporter ATP-binding protein EcfA2
MLLVGDNGAGKSTLLRVMAGRHIFRNDAVTVLGKHAFYDTSTCARFPGGGERGRPRCTWLAVRHHPPCSHHRALLPRVPSMTSPTVQA